MNYILLCVSSFLLALDFVLNKIYQNLFGATPKSTFLFNSLLGLFTALIFLSINRSLHFASFSLIMALLSGILVTSYNVIGFNFLKNGTLCTYTLFLMCGGMVLPGLYGILFLNESLGVLKTFAFIAILLGVILNCSGSKIKKNQILMCIVVFFINGFVSIISKIHQTQTVFNTINAYDFIIWSGISKSVFSGIVYLFVRKTDTRPNSGYFKTLPVIVLFSAFAGGFSYLLQLISAKTLPATMLYPFITGGSVIFSSVAATVIFKEKLSLKQVLSVALCFIGTLLYL